VRWCSGVQLMKHSVAAPPIRDVQIATICASIRVGSYNERLLRLAERALVADQVPVKRIRLDSIDLPLLLPKGDFDPLPPAAHLYSCLSQKPLRLGNATGVARRGAIPLFPRQDSRNHERSSRSGRRNTCPRTPEVCLVRCGHAGSTRASLRWPRCFCS
jgi:hypothetical protein